MSKPKNRVPTSGAQGALGNPFGGLQIEGLPEGQVAVPEQKHVAPDKRGRVVLRRETAHRGGKAVVIVSSIPPEISVTEIGVLAKELRNACGAGGTVREREIEIQGDQAGRVREALEKRGFRVDGER